jgi:CRISPR/Cas system-associated endonuclease Cas1
VSAFTSTGEPGRLKKGGRTQKLPAGLTAGPWSQLECIMKLSESSLTLSSGAIAEMETKHPIVLTDDEGQAVAAIIPIEDYYLLQKLEDCLSAQRPSSRFHDAAKRK